MTDPVDTAVGADALACPACQGALFRIRRRWFDRLVSLVTPLRRYRCPSHTCGWEGTRRAQAGALAGGARAGYVSGGVDRPLSGMTHGATPDKRST